MCFTGVHVPYVHPHVSLQWLRVALARCDCAVTCDPTAWGIPLWGALSGAKQVLTM